MDFVSRAGHKLKAALDAFAIDVTGLVCADLGSNVGGFVDCLLQHGAARVYAVEKGYGVVDWKLRKDPRVVVMERTNAMHVQLPEKMQLVTIDVAWTRQKNILPATRRILATGGAVITLIKPHYESNSRQLKKGILPTDQVEAVVAGVQQDICDAGFTVVARLTSPIIGTGGNVEVLARLRLTIDHPVPDRAGPSRR